MCPRKRDENATRTDYHRVFLLYTEGIVISFTNIKTSVATSNKIGEASIVLDSTV